MPGKRRRLSFNFFILFGVELKEFVPEVEPFTDVVGVFLAVVGNRASVGGTSVGGTSGGDGHFTRSGDGGTTSGGDGTSIGDGGGTRSGAVADVSGNDGDELVFASVCGTVAGCCVGGAGVCNTSGCINENCAVEIVADLLHLRLFLLVVVVVVGKVSLLKRFFLPSKS